jgi:hypothetical protein
VPQEVVSFPEVSVRNLIWHQLLHCCPQLRVLGEIRSDIICLLVDIKFLVPCLILGSNSILSKTFLIGMNDMQLRIESGRMDDALPMDILALEQNSSAISTTAGAVTGTIRWRRYFDSILQEVSQIRPKSQQCFISRVLCFLKILQPLRCFATQARKHCLGLLERILRRQIACRGSCRWCDFGVSAITRRGSSGSGVGTWLRVCCQRESTSPVDDGRSQVSEAPRGILANSRELLLGFMVDRLALVERLFSHGERGLKASWVDLLASRHYRRIHQCDYPMGYWRKRDRHLEARHSRKRVEEALYH